MGAPKNALAFPPKLEDYDPPSKITTACLLVAAGGLVVARALHRTAGGDSGPLAHPQLVSRGHSTAAQHEQPRTAGRAAPAVA